MSSLHPDDFPSTNHIPVWGNNPLCPIEQGHLSMFTCPAEVRVGERFEVTLSTDIREATNGLWVERFVEYATVRDRLVDLPLDGTVDAECENQFFEYPDLEFDPEAAGHTWLLEFYLYQMPMDSNGRPRRGPAVQIGKVSQRIKVTA